MISDITRPSTACYTLPMSIGFLLGEPSCSRLGKVMGVFRSTVKGVNLTSLYYAVSLTDDDRLATVDRKSLFNEAIAGFIA